VSGVALCQVRWCRSVMCRGGGCENTVGREKKGEAVVRDARSGAFDSSAVNGVGAFLYIAGRGFGRCGADVCTFIL
jgi:hypothetical protein